MKGDFTDNEMRTINRCRLFFQVECLSDVCTADGLTTDPGLEARTSSKVTSQSTIKWPREGLPRTALVGSMVTIPQTIHTWFYEQPAPPDTRPVDPARTTFYEQPAPPDLRNWPAYYDSSSQMLGQIVPPHATATLGTSSTSWTYHPAGIECTRRFIPYV
jgi:hypothetical protein